MAAVFRPDSSATFRNNVAPVRYGFSRFRRSMRSASCGGMVRDCPRSYRGCSASASNPPLRWRSAQSSNVSTETAVRLEAEISNWRAAICSARRVSSPQGSASSTSGAISP